MVKLSQATEITVQWQYSVGRKGNHWCRHFTLHYNPLSHLCCILFLKVWYSKTLHKVYFDTKGIILYLHGSYIASFTLQRMKSSTQMNEWCIRTLMVNFNASKNRLLMENKPTAITRRHSAIYNGGGVFVSCRREGVARDDAHTRMRKKTESRSEMASDAGGIVVC